MPVMRVPMKVSTAKKMQTLAVPEARERADSCSEAFSFPFLELGAVWLMTVGIAVKLCWQCGQMQGLPT